MSDTFNWKTYSQDRDSVILSNAGATERSPLCGSEGSVREKRCQMFQLTLLSLVPGIILIIRNTISLVDNIHFLEDNSYVMDNVKFSTSVGDVIYCLQIERGTSALYLSSRGDPLVKPRLLALYLRTDYALNKLSTWTQTNKYPLLATRQALHDKIRQYRENFDIEKQTLRGLIRFYSDINSNLITQIGYSINIDRGLSYWADLVAYQMMLISTEQAGIERALGSTYFARGFFPLEDLLWFREKNILGIYFLAQAVTYSNMTASMINALYANTSLNLNLELMRVIISKNETGIRSTISGTIWFDNMTDYINILKTIQDKLAFEIIQAANDQNQDLERTLILSAFELAIAVIIAPVVAILIRNTIQKIQSFAAELKEKTSDLEQERKRTETLLFQMLPRTVARKLMNQGHAIPEAYQSATIMFSDVVGFTSISSRSTPMQIVNMLNNLYMTIDSRLENFDVYKVETIGDGYMVASGLPSRNGERHVEEIAKLSLDLMSSVQHMDIPHITNEKLRLRIGFNTGPCVAGVVGIKMPRYCVFGDTVNTASRMESTGSPSKIQMTEMSANILQKLDCYCIKERGVIQLKGKGSMRTFWLNGYKKDTQINNQPLSPSKLRSVPTFSCSIEHTNLDSTPPFINFKESPITPTDIENSRFINFKSQTNGRVHDDTSTPTQIRVRECQDDSKVSES